jgi:site-specific DNA recombinase
LRVEPVGLVTAEKFFNQQAKTAFRDHLRALAQRGEVYAKEVRVMASKSVLRTLVAAFKRKTAGFGVPSSVLKWRARRDSNS